MKIGGIVNPLNLMLTPDEAAYAMNDCGAVAVFGSDDRIAGLAAVRAGTKLRLCVAYGGKETEGAIDFRSLLETTPGDFPVAGIALEQPCTVGYTSGTTGRPKGVAIQHSSAVALLAWANDVFTPEEFKGVLASTSICFDLSIFEIFAPLSSGGRVIIVADALRLPALESAAGVTLLKSQVLEPLLRGAFVSGGDQVRGNIDAQYVRPELRGWQRSGAVAASEIEYLHSLRNAKLSNKLLAAFPHCGRNASEVTLLPKGLVRVHQQSPFLERLSAR